MAPTEEPQLVSPVSGSTLALIAGPIEVLRALDGNTLLVIQNGNRYRVRLLGVTPSAEPRAAKALSALAVEGPARIEFDKRRVAPDGAWLAYMYVNERLVNAAIVRAGLGRYESYPGDSATRGRLIKEAESAARREKLGFWARP
jgi:endonuclease YncB( thermonuclease family)